MKTKFIIIVQLFIIAALIGYISVLKRKITFEAQFKTFYNWAADNHEQIFIEYFEADPNSNFIPDYEP